MTIDELQKIAKENFQRCVSLTDAVSLKIDSVITQDGENFMLVLGNSDTKEVLQLLQSINYCMQQAEIINTELASYHLNGLENYQLCFADKNSTDKDKIELLAKMVETAIMFVPEDIKEYLRAKRERIYSIVEQK